MKATDLPDTKFIKLLYVGHSGTGKTGSLVSLLEAGYDLRILSMDNSIAPLLHYAKLSNPKLLEHIDSMFFRDKFTADPIKGLRISGRAKAYTGALAAMNTWDDGSTPSEWGSKTIFVLDSLTSLARAAYFWADGMNPTAKDKRQIFGAAQESVRKMLELLTDDDFHAHVIVISHIQSITNEDDVLLREQVSSIGKALGPDIPKFFDTLICAATRGSGEKITRSIITAPTNTLDLKLPAELDKKLPLETGLATVFKSLLA